MRELKEKQCVQCGTQYQPTGSCSKYCPVCKPIFTKLVAKQSVKKWFIKTGKFKGTGSGSKLGAEASNYVNGRSVFRRWAKERKLTIGLCEHCGKNIKHATHYEWVGHHKDHNQTNNTIENLVLLCKQCHQIEHKCWKAFESVTTISKESRVDNNSKRTPSPRDDDIVCSV
jgi:hypothetical protein